MKFTLRIQIRSRLIKSNIVTVIEPNIHFTEVIATIMQTLYTISNHQWIVKQTTKYTITEQTTI
jgi:hypothetical protein